MGLPVYAMGALALAINSAAACVPWPGLVELLKHGIETNLSLPDNRAFVRVNLRMHRNGDMAVYGWDRCINH